MVVDFGIYESTKAEAGCTNGAPTKAPGFVTEFQCGGVSISPKHPPRKCTHLENHESSKVQIRYTNKGPAFRSEIPRWGC